ncbi:MAG TPA: carbamoyltransferase N-terminal domain-containing protein [Kofleriaceae bacterium]
MSCSFHDSGLAIVNSTGEIVFAEGTERYQQSKRAIQSPPDDVNRIHRLIKKYCEPGAEIVLAQTWSKQYRIMPMVQALDAINAGELDPIPPPVAAALRARGIDLGALDSDGTRYLINWMRWLVSANVLACEVSGIHARYRLVEASPQFAGRVIERTYNHHLTHASVACHSSPFDEAVCAVLDGSGERASNAFFHYKGGVVTELHGASVGPGSLGFFYWHLCWACGFDPLAGEEWKVMGLAPYGKLNQEILDETQFSQLHVFSAPADDGNAVGAALLAYQEDHPPAAPPAQLQSPYLGEVMSPETLGSLTSLGGLENRLPPGRSVASYAAELLSQGKIPLLLNTSFNVMGKPIIHSVEDALAVFFTSGLDVLVLEDMVILKS